MSWRIARWYVYLWWVETFMLGNVVAIDISPHLLQQIFRLGKFGRLIDVAEKLRIVQDVVVDDISLS